MQSDDSPFRRDRVFVGDLSRVGDLLREEGLDAVLVCRPWDVAIQPNVTYLVGHLTPTWDYSGLFILLRRAGPPIVIANEWLQPDPTGAIEAHAYPGHHMRFALPVLTSTIGELNLMTARIGIESARLPVGLFDAVRAANPHVTFVAGDRVLTRLRMRKTAAEVAMIRAAIGVAEEALLAATAALAPGRPLGEIEAAIKDIAYPDGRHISSAHFTSYRADGSESLDLPPHVIAGQVLVLDVNGVYAGYRADMARQMVYGAAPPELPARLADVVAMQQAMIEAIHPPMSVAAAYTATTAAAAPWTTGDPSFVFQLHGIGLETHEPPRFCSPNKPFFPLPEQGDPDDVLVSTGTVACLELGVGGAWIEDIFALTDTGGERLTTLPQTILTP